jgi:Na+:H+ antiporter, NhaA family
MTIPARVRITGKAFAHRSRVLLDHFEQAATGSAEINEVQRAALQGLEATVQGAEAPLQRLEHTLHPWVVFGVVPIFALANAGIVLGSDASVLLHPVSLGIVAGLVLGKQIGITSCVWLAVKTRLVDLPAGITWRQVYGVSWLAGIGFTMSIFIDGLAFGETPLLAIAKLGIITASLIAGIVGWAILKKSRPI